MNMRARTALVAASLLLLAAPAVQADEFSIKLKPGDGAEVTQGQCAACHSLDYIQMNSPFPKRAVWEAEVTKMIKVFGATIDDKDAKSIIDYLAKNYGS
jgi:mono/diheme cytochrome c family protein